jgi:hypothetical protein
MTALHNLLSDMRQLESKLSDFEVQFGVRSSDFYQAIMAGDLEELDALDEYRLSFIEWLALYKTWLSLNERYHQLLSRQPVALQIKTNLEVAHA